jgi:hypothetical protein
MPSKVNSDKDKIDLIRSIYDQALVDINKIKEGRDEKIRGLIKKIDERQIAKILEDIKK